MYNIFSKVFYEFEKGHDLMLVTIIKEAGSAPRGTGSQMLVNSSGRLVGTIGGGAIEYKSENLAMDFITKKKSERVDFELSEAEGGIGMACGGDVSVWFQYMSAQNPLWTALAESVISAIESKEESWLIQKLDGSLSYLAHKGEPFTVSGALLTDELFSMPLPIGERVIIFGGGHVAQALAPILSSVGFRVTVMDCREEYTRKELFPDAEKLVCGDYLNIKDYLTIGSDDYLVVMTNGHSHDFEVQEQVLRGEFAYVGVIGSAKKTAAVNQRLRDAGVPESGIEKVHTPIGTKIKAVTPAEIAVSIAGEMILERALRREAAGIKTGGCPMH